MPVRDKPIVMARHVQPISWLGVPWHIRKAFTHSDGSPMISAICRTLKECEDLVYWFGDADFCPFQPVLLLIPGALPKAICGDGYAPAAELRDCAVVTWERTLNTTVDFDVLREKVGLPERAKADAAIRDALWERAKRHKSSPVTDPMRQMVYPNPTNRTVFTHGGLPYEKEQS